MPDSLPTHCGDCGAPASPIKGDGLERWEIQHFPDCPTLQEQAAGVEVVTTYSDQGPRRCPKCGSAMTRNNDGTGEAWTDNCTGAMCGATLEADGPLEVEPAMLPAAAFDAIAAMPGAQVFEHPYPGEGQVCPSCLQLVWPGDGEPYVQNGQEFFHKPCWDDRRGQTIP